MTSAKEWHPFGLADEDFEPLPDRPTTKIVNLSGRWKDRKGKPGSALIGTAASLLLALGVALLVVSLAAQYTYVLAQRHQAVASMIEAAALDVGMIIFSLLALGLARAGQSAKIERALIVAGAAGSAVMNYAAADVTSPRSMLAYCMPPVFLAVVVDRVVVTVRRHVLGETGHSPWGACGYAALYLLRTLLAPASTLSGLRRWLLTSTPLPAAVVAPPDAAMPAVAPSRPCPAIEPKGARRDGTKTQRFLELAAKRHDLLALPLGEVSGVATGLAPEAELHPSTARRVLLAHVRALQAGSAS